MSDERPVHDEEPAGREEISAFGAGRSPRGTHRRLGLGAPRSPVRQGVTAALVLFAVAVALELAALTWVRLWGVTGGDVANVFFGLALFMILIGPLAALAVSLSLPKPARGPFWNAGIVCVFMAMILWGVTCAVAGPPPIGG